VYGCTAEDPFCNGVLFERAIVAMAYDSEHVQDSYIYVMENIDHEINIDKMISSMEEYFNVDASEAPYNEYYGITLFDAGSRAEVEIMDKIGSRTNLMLIGGSSANGMNFDETYLFANGKIYQNAAVIAFVYNTTGGGFIKTQSVELLDQVLVVTKCDSTQRIVYEFDNKPARIRYAEILGVEPSEAHKHLFSHPVGLIVGGDIYVRSGRRFLDDGAMLFASNMPERLRYRITKITDIIPDTQSSISKVKRKHGKISGIIDFRCKYRTVQLANERKIEEYCELFDEMPVIGFSTYGEQCYGHINQTSVMIYFK
jgi:hypothetical protein